MNYIKIVIFIFCSLHATLFFGQEKPILIDANANMYQVDDKLYRSEQLRPEDKTTFSKTDIKTIINLRYFTRSGNEKIFTQNDNVELINYPLLTWQVNPKNIAYVLWLIEQKQNKGAVLVHCYHGADRTGIMVAMYRIVRHNWSIEKAKNEMQKGPFGYHSIWTNLDKLFTPEVVSQVKEELQFLKKNKKV